MPPVSLDTFRNVANNAVFTSRDIEIHGKGANATARLGAYVFSAGKKANDATMAAFKAALEKEYGVFGTHAFDTVLGARSQLHKSLRACDVRATLSKLDTVKQMRFAGELNRQLDTNPKFRMLSPELRQKIRTTTSARANVARTSRSTAARRSSRRPGPASPPACATSRESSTTRKRPSRTGSRGGCSAPACA